jgi:E3 ubiquitin-protein ligase HERC2
MEASIIRKLSISESDFSHSEHESYSHGFMTTVADGTVFAWGSAKDGGLGTWKHDAHQPQKMEFDVKFNHIGAGVNFNVAISEKGQLYTWGDGEYGKLGNGDKFSRFIPTLLEDVQHVTFSALSVGYFHTAAITQEGHVYTWGLGAHGCLGHGDEFSQYKPRVITDLQHTRIVSVSAGKSHTLAVTDKGQVYAWGCGARYALGTGRTEDCYKPKVISFPSNVKIIQVSCGSYHSLALTADGRLYSWGYGAYGRLGHNDTSNVATPIKIEGFNYVPFAAVSAGHSHSMALSEEGEIYTWGKNSYGQLGHGDYNLSARPKKIKTSVTFISIVAAKYHSLALTGV